MEQIMSITTTDRLNATTPINMLIESINTLQNAQSYLATTEEHRFPLKEAIEGYLLSCKVEGKSPATIEAYRSKLHPFLWYVKNNRLPDSVPK